MYRAYKYAIKRIFECNNDFFRCLYVLLFIFLLRLASMVQSTFSRLFSIHVSLFFTSLSLFLDDGT